MSTQTAGSNNWYQHFEPAGQSSAQTLHVESSGDAWTSEHSPSFAAVHEKSAAVVSGAVVDDVSLSLPVVDDVSLSLPVVDELSPLADVVDADAVAVSPVDIVSECVAPPSELVLFSPVVAARLGPQLLSARHAASARRAERSADGLDSQARISNPHEKANPCSNLSSFDVKMASRG